MTDVDKIVAGIKQRAGTACEAQHLGSVMPGVWEAEYEDSDYAVHIAEDRRGQYWSVLDQVPVMVAGHIAANDPAHVLAVLAAAREELADALEQQDRHQPESPSTGGQCCGICGVFASMQDVYPCADAERADRTLARLAALYAVTLTPT